ncbi:MAG TPA: VanZ family protein [Thermoanaerobaculia bacterium]|nr:VanZ family protein [Thermoanaerobaculia bacterium]
MTGISGAAILERALRVLPALLYLAFIWGMSGLHATELSNVDFDDRLAHFGEYGLLALLLVFALTAFDPERVHARSLLLAGAISIGWGALDEIHQSWVPGRDSSVKDFAFDALGTVAALAATAWLARRQRSAR